MVNAATMPGMASGKSTFSTIWLVLAPMAWAASIRPASTSRSAVSTQRAMKGATATVSGTTAAQVPIEEPVTQRVKGMMATSKMMNGVERAAFTNPPTMALTGGLGRMPPRSVRRKNTPSGTPNTAPSRPEIPTMMMVSHSASSSNCTIISEKFSNMLCPFLLHAHLHALGLQIGHRRRNLAGWPLGKHGQRAKGLALNFIDLPMQNGQIQPQLTDQMREHRLVCTGPGVGQTQQLSAGTCG